MGELGIEKNAAVVVVTSAENIITFLRAALHLLDANIQARYFQGYPSCVSPFNTMTQANCDSNPEMPHFIYGNWRCLLQTFFPRGTKMTTARRT